MLTVAVMLLMISITCINANLDGKGLCKEDVCQKECEDVYDLNFAGHIAGVCATPWTCKCFEYKDEVQGYEPIKKYQHDITVADKIDKKKLSSREEASYQ